MLTYYLLIVHSTRIFLLSLSLFLTAFIASYPQGCVMSFITGSDTTIPADAAVSIVTHDDIQCTLEGQEVELTSHEDTNEVAFKLPEIPPDSSHDIHVTLTVPSMQVVGVVNHTHQPTPKAWKHEVIDRYMTYIVYMYIPSVHALYKLTSLLADQSD